VPEREWSTPTLMVAVCPSAGAARAPAAGAASRARRERGGRFLITGNPPKCNGRKLARAEGDPHAGEEGIWRRATRLGIGPHVIGAACPRRGHAPDLVGLAQQKTRPPKGNRVQCQGNQPGRSIPRDQRWSSPA